MVFRSLARRLRERREAFGLTQGEAAEAIGVTQQHLSALERGESRPPMLEHVSRWARLYGTTVDYLLGMTDNPAPGAGAPLPSGWEQMLGIMGQLSEDGRAELLDVAGVMAQHEARRAEWNQTAAELVRLVGDDEAARLLAQVIAAVRTGDESGIDGELPAPALHNRS